jgi:hypothetical protein
MQTAAKMGSPARMRPARKNAVYAGLSQPTRRVRPTSSRQSTSYFAQYADWQMDSEDGRMMLARPL